LASVVVEMEKDAITRELSLVAQTSDAGGRWSGEGEGEAEEEHGSFINGRG